MRFWKHLRIPLLAFTCANVLFVFGRSILDPSIGQPIKKTQVFPSVVPLQQWQPVASQPLKEQVVEVPFVHKLVLPGHHYRYIHKGLPLEIKMRYAPDTDGDVQQFIAYDTQIPSSNVRHSLVLRHQSGLGFYGLMVYQQRAHLNACINPLGGSTFTAEQFSYNRMHYDVQVAKSNSNEWWFSPLFRIVGYGLLAFSLFDIIDMFVPSRFGEAGWEFQLVTNLVERVPVPLLGLVLVLVSEKKSQLFKFLTWASLVVAVLFFLLIPFGISAGVRIDQQAQVQRSAQLNQQIAPLQQLQNQVKGATSAQQLEELLSRLNSRGQTPKINNPEKVKSQLLSELSKTEKRLRDQNAASQANTRLLLLKNALKSLLGALVSGFLFLTIWRHNRETIKANRRRERA